MMKYPPLGRRGSALGAGYMEFCSGPTPGQTDGPEVRAVIERLIQEGGRTGVAPGLHLRDPRTAAEWLGRGVRLLSCMTETVMLMQAGTQIVSALRAAPPS